MERTWLQQPNHDGYQLFKAASKGFWIEVDRRLIDKAGGGSLCSACDIMILGTRIKWGNYPLTHIPSSFLWSPNAWTGFSGLLSETVISKLVLFYRIHLLSCASQNSPALLINDTKLQIEEKPSWENCTKFPFKTNGSFSNTSSSNSFLFLPVRPSGAGCCCSSVKSQQNQAEWKMAFTGRQYQGLLYRYLEEIPKITLI